MSVQGCDWMKYGIDIMGTNATLGRLEVHFGMLYIRYSFSNYCLGEVTNLQGYGSPGGEMGTLNNLGSILRKPYSPVAISKSIRILLDIATWYDYEIWQMDVKTAFLNGFIEEEIFMDQPEGFTSVGEEQKSIVSKGPSTASNKLPKVGTHVLMKSYGL
ncbi:UNVERIFIED_CONTAM: hypothetical protein Slati_3089000 [Sesamum latifolium]|uniref:Reverse transcriptase Ty1/copia-type domain-containing protein n=1 Tax=Sesamum latifolium TaxID=2727402 RepID=A0AAW2UX48_9LAMI